MQIFKYYLPREIKQQEFLTYHKSFKKYVKLKDNLK